MTRRLINSQTDRQNLLHRPNALAAREKAPCVVGIPIESRSVLLKKPVTAFLAIKPRTVDQKLKNFADEPRQTGYDLIRGKRLQQLKLSRQAIFGHEAHFVTKTNVPGMLDFLAVRSRRKIAAQLVLAKELP